MTGRAYYNEIDPYCCEWIRNLMDAGFITKGDVDSRSIVDVRPADVRGYTRCHWFAGIAVWDYALALAGWPADRPVWTGSCPCQPFSAAGRGGGFADERHLWPHWHHLIRECRPAAVLGEQVASGPAGPWLDLVFDDLEALDYACGAVPFPAAGVGAPHIRDRLWFVADADGGHTGPEGLQRGGQHGQQPQDGLAGILADPSGIRPPAWSREPSFGSRPLQPERPCLSRFLGDADRLGEAAFGGFPAGPAAQPAGGFWAAAEWLPCRDGKWRPVEPGTFPLAHGAPGRVGRLRAYGNAICAEAAAAFIRAVFDVAPARFPPTPARPPAALSVTSGEC